MSDIQYQFGAISAASADITATSGRISGQLATLKSDVAPMAGAWEGEAAVAWNEAQTKWDTAAADLNEILRTVARVVETGNDNMSNTNRSAAAAWGV
ncbi:MULTISPECIES: WXG100 family type VII secretion target [Corynebacterium]|uniref:WXG100 family type VII secretion target n=1 Tax=Corynebacterium TaxID=1716 RepID=UPI00254F67C8|nr:MULTISPECIES: WXG100 family type VII secretion target [Corynebacterium]MDK6260881.1 WXG100 family type VII secretion target [Corynebacterium frankenforstense]MDK8895780.1 WXG100 family type VII secretion target [Corynebacterium sp. MSK006]